MNQSITPIQNPGRRAFTLVELLVFNAIISILVAMLAMKNRVVHCSLNSNHKDTTRD